MKGCFVIVVSVVLLSIYTAAGCNSVLAKSRLTGQPINVREYGAKGDGIEDDAPALKAAIQQAITSGIEEVFLPNGRYRLASADTRTHCIDLKGISNLSLVGEAETVIIMDMPKRGFIQLQGCRNVTIRNIRFDYNPLPFTQGTVMAIDPTTGVVDWKLDEGYPDPTDPFFEQEYAFRFYEKDGRIDLKAPLKIGRSLEYLSHGMYRVVIDRSQQGGMSNIRIGQKLVLAPRYFPSSLIRLSECEDIVLEKLFAYAGPEAFIVQVNCEGTLVKGCVVEPLPGSNRLQSITADTIYSVGGRRGPRIEDCRFVGNGDDNINIHGTCGLLYDVAGPTEIIATETPWVGLKRTWRVGDHLLVLRKDNGETVVNGKIILLQETEADGMPAWRVELDKPIQDKTFLLAEREKRPPAFVFNANYCGNGFVVRNNIFRNHRARGIVARSFGGLIENNTFDWLEGGIYLGLELGWPEGPGSQAIIVRNNTFSGMGYMSNGAIEVVDRTIGSATGINNRDIVISSNTFEGCFRRAIFLDNASNVTVKDNRIRVIPERRLERSFTEANEIYTGNHCENISIVSNELIVEGAKGSPMSAKVVKVGDVWTMEDIKYALSGEIHNPSMDGFGNENVWHYMYAAPGSQDYFYMDEGKAGQLPTWWIGAYLRVREDPECYTTVNIIEPGAKYDAVRVFVSPVAGVLSITGHLYMGQPEISSGVKLMVMTPKGVESRVLTRDNPFWEFEIRDVHVNKGDKIILRANNNGDKIADNIYLKFYNITYMGLSSGGELSLTVANGLEK